ncbi:MAG: radical SAM protein [Elusimicrobia bacterium]|nr:radical SAM protein [Elusimicrobiota bacterium]
MDSRSFQALLRVVERSNHTGYPTPYPALAAWDPVAPGLALRAWRGMAPEEAGLGLYVHIPFCPKRCAFCFLPVWGVGDRSRVAGYLDALAREAAIYAEPLRGRRFRSVYIGGGTPSLLDGSELDRLFSTLERCFARTGDCQVAMEANPESLDRAQAGRLKSLGVNWLTLGVQSLEPGVLRASGRPGAGAAARAYAAARAAGIPGINVDLLFGLPGQSRSGFLRDVYECASWRPDQIHLNVYVNAPKTALARRGHRVNRVQFQEALRVQAEGFRTLEAAGYARIDADSAGLTPESVNWQGARAMAARDSILGLGIVSVSYVRGALRYVNSASLSSYLGALRAGRLPVERGIALNPRREMINFALQNLEHGGVLHKKRFRKLFGTELRREFAQAIRNLKIKEVLRERRDAYVLTDHPGGVFEYSREFYEPAIIQKIAGRYRLPGSRR